MSPSASNPSSPRHFPHPSSTRRVSTGPRAPSSSSTPSSSSPSYESIEYPFTSPTAIQINRTVSVTVEVSSNSTTASHMDVSQYNMPVTTSCYSPTSGTFYEHLDASSSEYGTSTSNLSQGTYSIIPSATSDVSLSYYGQSSGNGTQGSSGYSYESSQYHSVTGSQQQHGIDPTHTFSNIKPSRPVMLEDYFLGVNSREDALVVEARAAIRQGGVRDENTFAPNIYGWETVIDSL